MKKVISLIFMMGFLSLYAQNKASDFSGRNTDMPRDPRADQMSFVPNEVIVKFKDQTPLNAGTRLRAAGIKSIDKVLKANKVAPGIYFCKVNNMSKKLILINGFYGK